MASRRDGRKAMDPRCLARAERSSGSRTALVRLMAAVLLISSCAFSLAAAEGRASKNWRGYGEASLQNPGWVDREDAERAARYWSRWRVATGSERANHFEGAAAVKVDVAQRCSRDLFALFGGEEAAASVERSRAEELRACVRVLAPEPQQRRWFTEENCMEGTPGGSAAADFVAMIESPPLAIQDLARKTVEWGGDRTVVLNALQSVTFPVPDVEGAAETGCSLTKYEYGKRFMEQELNQYMSFLFLAIQKLAPSAGLNVSLSRFDLFHGHMFTAFDTGRLGILFHSREFPQYSEDRFPYNLGYCQKGSPVPYDTTMSIRNIIWLAPMPDCVPDRPCSREWLAPGALFVLDTGEGGILGRELVPEWLDIVHTVQEEDLGNLVLDVNYFESLAGSAEDRLFLC